MLRVMDDVRLSKLLARVLRHAPESVGVRLDEQGWADVDELLAGLRCAGREVLRAQLERVVAQSDKQRFELDGGRIRANQGHSVPVDLKLESLRPPYVLFHGTPERNAATIERDGLHRGTRHHVHLSDDVETATRVGARRGRPVVFVVSAARMADAGHLFYRSRNGVWLTDVVPPDHLSRATKPREEHNEEP